MGVLYLSDSQKKGLRRPLMRRPHLGRNRRPLAASGSQGESLAADFQIPQQFRGSSKLLLVSTAGAKAGKTKRVAEQLQSAPNEAFMPPGIDQCRYRVGEQTRRASLPSPVPPEE